MSFCTNCGKPVNEGSNFCRNCGAPVGALAEQMKDVPAVQPDVAPVEQTYAAPAEQTYAVPVEPVYVQPVAPVYAVPVEQTYAVPAEPEISVKTKVLGFVGMGVSIFGLFFSVFGLLNTLIGMSEYAMGFGMAVAFSLFSLPCGIVGMVLSNQSRNAGNIAKSASVGAKLGLASVIVSCVMLFLGFVNLMA